MKTSPKKALLALSLTHDETNLIRYARDFSKTFQFDLEVIHVIRGSGQVAAETLYFPESLMPVIPDSEQKERAKEKLQLQLEENGFDSELLVHVATGWFEDCVNQLIHESGVDLLIVGRHQSYDSAIKRFTSSLNGLAYQTHSPILVVPEDYSNGIAHNPRLLITDSLSSVGSQVTDFGLDIALRPSKAGLIQVHVCEDIRYEVDLLPKDQFELIFEMMAKDEDDESSQELIELVSEHIKNAMADRLEKAMERHHLDVANFEIDRMLLFGKVSEEMESIDRLFNFDIAFVGAQNRSLFNRILYQDQLSFKSQMHMTHPIIIVPTAKAVKSKKRSYEGQAKKKGTGKRAA